MIHTLCSMMVIGLFQFGFQNTISQETVKNVVDRAPEFFVLEWKQGTKLTEKKTELFIEVDLLGRQDISVLVDKNNRPVLYVSDISTPVCADGECRLMHIRLYWTLLGGYAGFDRYIELPLTKHDHDEFRVIDYQKLHELLKDKYSILGRRAIDQLVKKPKEPKMEGVDAVAGATIKEVKESVVSGALYSCYVAWHLVHGEIREKIKENLLCNLTDSMVLNMLHSNHSDYQMFALKELNEKGYEEQYIRIAEIFETGIPLIRAFIIKNLTEIFWDSSKSQQPFWESFAHVDINSRSLLLTHLNKTSGAVLELISMNLDIMTKNQLKVYLDHISKKKTIDPGIKKNLYTFATSGTETYAYLVKQFLVDYQ